jgi:type I restriction enzyme M protein
MGIVLPEGVFNNPSLAYVREFCEDRAFIRAVVSLPQETFLSSGASVKASLLFLQKFTEKEQAEFDRRNMEACSEVEAKYEDEIAAERTRFNDAIVMAREALDIDRRKELQRELADFGKRMEQTIAAESRALLKQRFPYLIFLCEPQKVGITATGEADQNELFPNDNTPPELEVTSLDLYHQFRRNPEAFLLRENAQ